MRAEGRRGVGALPAEARRREREETFITGDVYGWGYLMAGAVLTTLPVIAVSSYLQRYMVEGLTAGSVKG